MPAGAELLTEDEGQVGDVALRRVLGKGAFSSVWEGADADGRAVALKRIAKRDVKTLRELKNVVAELKALRALSGGHGLLEFRGTLASKRYVYFMLEHFGTEL